MTRPLDSTALKRLHRSWRRRPVERLGLLLDSVQSPFNVGAILRTAAALRVDHLWLAGDTAPPTHPKTAKTALGSQRYLSWSRHPTAADAAGAARAAGYAIVGLELAEGAVPLPEAHLTGAVCLVVGHEDRGLPPASLALCDEVAYIPQLGRIGSLNVATATAIGLYEVRRRAWAAGPGGGNRGGAGDGAGLPSTP